MEIKPANVKVIDINTEITIAGIYAHYAVIMELMNCLNQFFNKHLGALHEFKIRKDLEGDLYVKPLLEAIGADISKQPEYHIFNCSNDDYDGQILIAWQNKKLRCQKKPTTWSKIKKHFDKLFDKKPRPIK